jgi:hypothetical protein
MIDVAVMVDGDAPPVHNDREEGRSGKTGQKTGREEGKKDRKREGGRGRRDLREIYP